MSDRGNGESDHLSLAHLLDVSRRLKDFSLSSAPGSGFSLKTAFVGFASQKNVSQFSCGTDFSINILWSQRFVVSVGDIEMHSHGDVHVGRHFMTASREQSSEPRQC